MHWLQTLDVGLLRFINLTLSNRFFDVLMPFLSGNALFVPAVILGAAILICKGGRRGLICVVMLVLIVWMGDSLVCNTIKHATERLRPCNVYPDIHALIGRSDSFSLPSSHAANWFAATALLLLFYPRSWRITLPLACAVSFSRVYNGVHYPSDVLAGAILGAGYSIAAAWSADRLWLWAGQKWFPLWWRKMPYLIERAGAPGKQLPASTQELATASMADEEGHWLRFGYVLIGLFLLIRLGYLASGFLELTGDEAYQWLWSKHLALSYYSKPPFIAYTQFLGTSIWGDNEFGVRFFSPILSAGLGFLMIRFFARELNARLGIVLALISTATPLAALGAILMTVDPLSVFFWTAAMISGWRAVQGDALRDWLWTGLWMGFGFLSKYTEVCQLVCWAVFFILWPASRRHLKRPGPYLALLINLICSLPVLYWNGQHHWVTVTHVAGNAAAFDTWHPTLRFFFDFTFSEFGLLNPVFFVGFMWAAIAFWKHERGDALLIYFFSMGAPLFLGYWLFTFHSRVFPNWIAPSVVPLFCLMVAWWGKYWPTESRRIRPWLVGGLTVGWVVVIFLHRPDLLPRLTHYRLPPGRDPTHRAHGWRDVAKITGQLRTDLLAEGKPVFIIADHYRLAGEISFYLPAARAAGYVKPLVYCPTTEVAGNQLFFWPGYSSRKGESAVYIRELDRDDARPEAAPAVLLREFESVTDLGTREVLDHGKRLWILQVFACRGLR
jgi:membrane-associated phospholipid phosphatase